MWRLVASLCLHQTLNFGIKFGEGGVRLVSIHLRRRERGLSGLAGGIRWLPVCFFCPKPSPDAYGKKAGAHSLILLDSMPYITIGVSE
jgi:hypothetical protein